MIPNLDFIRTMLEGIRESVFSRIASVASGLERKIRDVDERVQVPDYNAVMGDPGFIKNKPTLVGRTGEAEGAEVFNDYERNSATGAGSHAEGSVTSAAGDFSHAEGANTQASGNISHAEGSGTIAASLFQHVQGKRNLEDANQKYAHIVGNGSEKKRSNAHTLDWNGNAWFAGKVFVGGSGQDDASAETLLTDDTAQRTYAPIAAPAFTGSISLGRKKGTVVGDYSVAEGYDCEASDGMTHAEGFECAAKGYGSHAEGIGTVAKSFYQHVQGKYNLEDAAFRYAHIVGNGTADTNRSNAHTLDWYGNAWFAGNVFLGGTGQNDPNAVKLGAYEEWTFTLEDGSTVTKKVLVIG